MVKFLPLKANTIGDLYTISNSLPAFHLPKVNLEIIGQSASDAFTIAILAAIESLLSCVVADGMINGKHCSDMELVIVLVVLMPYAGLIPMPTIAAALNRAEEIITIS